MSGAGFVCVFLNAVREPRTNFRNKWQKIIKVADIKNKDIWSFTDFASFHPKYIHILNNLYTPSTIKRPCELLRFNNTKLQTDIKN